MEQLTGYTVAVTARRHRAELASALERRGARVVVATTLRIVPPEDDDVLRAATVELVRDPPQVTVVSTDAGFAGWLAAADAWGLGAGLRASLEDGVVKSLDGFDPVGLRVAVQLHGDLGEDVLTKARAAGAVAIPVPVYRWTVPNDPAPVLRLVDAICARRVDAVTFTSAPAARALLRTAGDLAPEVLTAMRGGVLAVAIGPTAAAPLARYGVPVAIPSRPRLDALAREVARRLPEGARRIRLNSSHELELRGHVVLLDGDARTLPPAPMAVLRALCEANGKVLSRLDLLRHLPRGADGHAVEMAVTRLRNGLGLRSCVRTVVKRGYRLDLR